MPTLKASSSKKKSSPRVGIREAQEADAIVKSASPPMDAGALLKLEIQEDFTRRRDELLGYLTDLTRRLVRHPTVNVPPQRLGEFPFLDQVGQEGRLLAVIEPELAESKLEFKTYEKVKGRPNLVASVGKGRKKLMVACRLDVTPPGHGWKGNAFEPVVADGVIRGRGTVDCKGPLAAAILAAKTLKPMERQLKGQLLIAAVSDTLSTPGKTKSDCGIDFLLQESLIKPDFAIVPSVGGDLQTISVAEKGHMIIHVRVIGKQTHAALTNQGDNAVLRMAVFLSKLNSISLPFTAHPLLGKPSVSVGLIRGGASPDLIPGECEAYLDVRFLPRQKPESVLEALKKVATSVGGSRFRMKEVFRSEPLEVDPDNILVRSIQANMLRNSGAHVPAVGSGLATMAPDLARIGAIAVGFGPGRQVLINSGTEQVPVAQLLDFARILTHVTIDLFT